MSISVKKLSKKFGIEIINFNLSKDLNQNTFKEILYAFESWAWWKMSLK